MICLPWQGGEKRVGSRPRKGLKPSVPPHYQLRTETKEARSATADRRQGPRPPTDALATHTREVLWCCLRSEACAVLERGHLARHRADGASASPDHTEPLRSAGTRSIMRRDSRFVGGRLNTWLV
jgi:hypothetical protein